MSHKTHASSASLGSPKIHSLSAYACKKVTQKKQNEHIVSLVHQILRNHSWELGCKEAIDCVAIEFQRNYPQLIFDREYAESAYKRLTLKHSEKELVSLTHHYYSYPRLKNDPEKLETKVKKRFGKCFPRLSFDPKPIHCAYALLQEKEANELIHQFMHTYCAKGKEWDGTNKEVVEKVEKDFKQLYPNLPFNRTEANRAFFLLQEQYVNEKVFTMIEDYLTKHKNWDADWEGIVEIMENAFNETYPNLPFNPKRAKSIFLFLQEKNRLNLIDNMMKDLFAEEKNWGLTRAKAVQQVKEEFNASYPDFSFDHQRATTAFVSERHKYIPEMIEKKVRNYLAEHENWDLNYHDGIQMIQKELHRTYSQLSFSETHIGRAYRELQTHIYTLIQSLIDEQLTNCHDEDPDCDEMVRQLEKTFRETYPTLPFDRSKTKAFVLQKIDQ